VGYYTRLSGGFNIEPPITYGEFIAAGYNEEDLVTPKKDLDLLGGHGELFFTIQRTRQKTTVGYKVDVTCSRVDAYEDQMKCYGLSDSVKRLVVDFGRTHTFSGTVNAFGEEDGDIWRIKALVNGEMIEEHPKLVWPDGSTSSL
jgi:hypothetical protein